MFARNLLPFGHDSVTKIRRKWQTQKGRATSRGPPAHPPGPDRQPRSRPGDVSRPCSLPSQTRGKPASGEEPPEAPPKPVIPLPPSTTPPLDPHIDPVNPPKPPGPPSGAPGNGTSSGGSGGRCSSGHTMSCSTRPRRASSLKLRSTLANGSNTCVPCRNGDSVLSW